MKSRIRLKSFNTFSVDVCAEHVITVRDERTLLRFYRKAHNEEKPVLILGEGSNVLFVDNYIGTILLNRIRGIFITENKMEWKLHVGAGEKWHKLVVYTLNNNMPGLENLACIPGYVGAAPIQNIGAYGLELSQVCEYVDVIDLYTEKKIRFTCTECNFKYRDSIFKSYYKRYVIVFVGLVLRKKWKPILNYYELNYLSAYNITPRQIFYIINMIRYKKLPNPILMGNAGSFFKNPIVNVKEANYLRKIYPSMPYYQKEDKIKLSAGWLIEHCQLKNCVFGEVAIYSKHASVLVNTRKIAAGTEIAALAFFIYNKVAAKFNIYLQPEVRFIGKFGEINSKKLFI